jgi:hypothetical protein
VGNGVDASGISTSIGNPSDVVTMGLVWNDEIGQSQWYRISIALDTPETDAQPGGGAYYVNPPGTKLTILSEQFGIQDDGMQYTQLTIRNDSNYQVTGEDSAVTVIFSLNVASTYSRE